MDRLLVLRLESVGVVAEAFLNGVPLARTGPGMGLVTLPVHEYTLAGSNEIELVIEPAPPGLVAAPRPLLSDGKRGASLRLLLPRTGQQAHPENARSLGEIDWAPALDEVTEVPATMRRRVDLPIGFPRWRWLDAPAIAQPGDWLKPATALLQAVALGLARGDPEPMVNAARLRFEELAQAYQRDLAGEVGRWRALLKQQHASQPLKPVMPTSETLLLRPLAGGRLLECLTLAGEPALSSPIAGGGRASWPVRLSAIDGQLYVLR